MMKKIIILLIFSFLFFQTKSNAIAGTNVSCESNNISYSLDPANFSFINPNQSITIRGLDNYSDPGPFSVHIDLPDLYFCGTVKLPEQAKNDPLTFSFKPEILKCKNAENQGYSATVYIYSPTKTNGLCRFDNPITVERLKCKDTPSITPVGIGQTTTILGQLNRPNINMYVQLVSGPLGAIPDVPTYSYTTDSQGKFTVTTKVLNKDYTAEVIERLRGEKLCSFPIKLNIDPQPTYDPSAPPTIPPGSSTITSSDPCGGAKEDAKKSCLACLSSNPEATSPVFDLIGSKSWTALGCVSTDPEGFVGQILPGAIGVGGGIAFLIMLWGIFTIIVSSGNPEKLNQGKEMIVSAIAGLLMILFSVFLLKVIGVDILRIPGFI